MTEHTENHKASSSQLEANLQSKIKELDQKNDNYLKAISELKTLHASTQSELESKHTELETVSSNHQAAQKSLS
jgi:hypothetical protein